MQSWYRRIVQYGVGLAGVLLLLSCDGTPGMAQTAFTAASLNGTYAGMLVGQNGATPVVALLLITMDGSGAITSGRTIWNIPQGFDKRANQEIPITSGSYEVNIDGKGTLTTPDLGIPSWHMAIVHVEPQGNGIPLARELFWTGDTVEPFGANVVTATLKRLPDGATFSEASLAGVYTRHFQGSGGLAPIAGVGVVALDSVGNGVGIGPLSMNFPGEGLGQRQRLPFPSEGVFDVSADGIVTVTGESSGVLVVTGAQLRDDGVFVITEGALVLNELIPVVGSLATATIARQLPVD